MKNLIFMAMALSTSTAFALPTVYPTKPGVLESVITSDQVNSKFVMDTHDDNAFYVLPPQKAYAYATNISVANANLGFCQDMINIQSASHVISDRLKQITAEQDAYQPTLDAAQRAVIAAQSALSGYSTSNTTAGQLMSLNQTISDNQDRLDALYSRANTCMSDCNAIYTEIHNVQDANRDLATSRQDLIRQNRDISNQITRLTVTSDAASAALTAANNRFAQIGSAKQDLLRSLTELYRTYATLEGGTANFEYTGDWANQAALLNALNPGKSFSEIGVHDVKIDASVMGANSDALASMPAFLSSTIDGRTNTNSTIDVGTYPEQFTANVRLSLAGACPIIHPADFGIGPIEAGKIKLGVSVKYTFDSAFNTKINCLYDEKEMYKKVLSSGNSGFMFWKKSWQSIDISDIKDTTFACNWDGLPGASMTFAERRKFEADALNYAIATMLSKYSKPADPIVEQPAIPSSGLTEVGQSLDRLCGSVNIYCKAAGWGLQALNSLFGSGQSTGSGTNNTDYKVHLQWDESLTYPVDGQTNFNTDRV